MTKHDAPPSDVVSTTSGSSDAVRASDESSTAYTAPFVYPNKTLGIVHPSGKMVWVPYNEHCSTLDHLKQDVARAWSIDDLDFQIARSTPLLGDALIDHQCMEGEILYLLPKVSRSGASTVTPIERKPEMNVAQKQPAMPAGGQGHAMHGGWYHLPVEEKIVHASINLLKIVNNSKQCTELQTNLDLAKSMNVDVSPVLMKVSAHLPELVIHPAGNYLVSKCFDYHPPLIDQASDLICADIKTYALHKHASYLIESILTHPKGSPYSKNCLITEIFSVHNRVEIATHDSGNFVIQKAIDVCPAELFQLAVEGVQAVALLTPHWPKMQKKIQAKRSQQSMQQPQQQQQHQGQEQMPQQVHPPVHSEYIPMDTYHDPYDPAFGGQVHPAQMHQQQQQQPTTPTTVQYNPYGNYSMYNMYDCQAPHVQKQYCGSVPPSTTPTSTEEVNTSGDMLAASNMTGMSWADSTEFGM